MDQEFRNYCMKKGVVQLSQLQITHSEEKTETKRQWTPAIITQDTNCWRELEKRNHLVKESMTTIVKHDKVEQSFIMVTLQNSDQTHS